MSQLISMAVLFFARILDNVLSTAKTIMIQKNKGILAGITVVVSNFLYFAIMKKVVFADDAAALIVVAVASGIGCWLAVMIGNKFSRERTFVNVIMCDNRLAMQELRKFLAEHHITNVATETITKDGEGRTITITAYAETKNESRLINRYLQDSSQKFKRLVHKL